MQDLWNKIKSIVTAPLTSDLDMVHLFLLIGLTLVFIGAWLMILNDLAKVEETL